MKALILTVSAGEGHNSMSRAVANCLEGRCEIDIYDLFKGKVKSREKTVNDGYFWLCKNNIKLANGVHRIIRNRNPKSRKYTLAHTLARPALKKLVTHLNDFNPDVIFTAHTYAGILMNDLKRKKGFKPPVVTIMSDYDMPPYSECCIDLEYIVSPFESFADDFVVKGFAPEQVLHLGIPVQQKFSEQIDKKQARRELEIDEDAFTVMIMNGGIGFGNALEVVKNLSKAKNKFQIIVVNGKNEVMKNSIDAFMHENDISYIKNIGFANNVDVIMSASDVLIGKIGGVAIAEAFNKKLPILASHIQPWQEHYNMLFLRERGACDYIENIEEIFKHIDSYIDDPQILVKMREEMAKIAKPKASADIADLLIKLGDEYVEKKEK